MLKRNRNNIIDMGCYWLSREEYDNKLPADEVVIENTEIQVEYSYPLSTRHIHIHKTENSKGFTRKELFKQIAAHYLFIYDTEDAAVGPTGTVTPEMLNRGFSEGPYGIWGHYLSDLTLDHAELREDGVYELGISS